MATLQEKLALLKDLEDENEAVQTEIDDLMTEMALVPAEQRSVSEWGPNGIHTTRFIELSERQAELAEEIKLVTQALGKEKPPESSVN
jgi:hypothetical protein